MYVELLFEQTRSLWLLALRAAKEKLGCLVSLVSPPMPIYDYVIERENLNELGAPDDHAAGVVGSGDAVRDQTGELPMRWWS